MSISGTPWEQPPQQPDFRRAVNTAPAPQRGPGGFQGDEIFIKAFSVIFANIAPFGLLAIVTLSFQYFYGFLAVDLSQMGGSSVGFLSEYSIDIFTLLTTYLLSAALAHGTFQALAGQHVSIGDCVLRGLGRLRAVAGVAVISWVASFLVGLIFTFLISTLANATWLAIFAATILNAMITTMLWVAILASVIERGGGIKSVFRSLELITGYRWKIFGMAVLFILMSVAAGFFTGLFLAPFVGQTVALIVAFVLTAGIAVLSAVVGESPLSGPV